MSRPLRSAPVTGTSALLRAGPPALAASVLSASRCRRPARSLSRPASSRAQYQRVPSHVPHASRRPGSRHLHAGHRLASNTGIPPGSSRGGYARPGSDAIYPVSTPQQWFTRVRLPGPRLTALTPPFPHRSPQRSSAKCSMRWLGTSPRRAAPRGHEPSSCVQHAHQSSPPTRRLLSVLVAQRNFGLADVAQLARQSLLPARPTGETWPPWPAAGWRDGTLLVHGKGTSGTQRMIIGRAVT